MGNENESLKLSLLKQPCHVFENIPSPRPVPLNPESIDEFKESVNTV